MNTSAAPRRPLKVGVQLPEIEWPIRWPELAATIKKLSEQTELDVFDLEDLFQVRLVRFCQFGGGVDVMAALVRRRKGR